MVNLLTALEDEVRLARERPGEDHTHAVRFADLPGLSVEGLIMELFKDIIGKSPDIDYAVVAVPGTLSNASRQRLRAIFTALGVRRCLVVSDSIALVHTVAMHIKPPPSTQYVILDVGHAKTTVTVVSVDTPIHVTVLATRAAGVGGAAFDEKLLRFVKENMRSTGGAPVPQTSFVDTILRTDLDHLKSVFCGQLLEYKHETDIGDEQYAVTITRDTFLEIIQSDLDAIEALLKETLALAERRSGRPTTQFFLHGSSSRLWCFPEMVRRLGHEPLFTLNQDDSVLEGCSRMAENNAGIYEVTEVFLSLQIAHYVDAGQFELVLGSVEWAVQPFPERETLVEFSELSVTVPETWGTPPRFALQWRGEPVIAVDTPYRLNDLQLTCGLYELLYSRRLAMNPTEGGETKTAEMRFSVETTAGQFPLLPKDLSMAADPAVVEALRQDGETMNDVEKRLVQAKELKTNIRKLSYRLKQRGVSLDGVPGLKDSLKVYYWVEDLQRLLATLQSL